MVTIITINYYYFKFSALQGCPSPSIWLNRLGFFGSAFIGALGYQLLQLQVWDICGNKKSQKTHLCHSLALQIPSCSAFFLPLEGSLCLYMMFRVFSCT